MKDIVILGSTGSIGTQALDVIRTNPQNFQIKALACGKNIDLLTNQISEFKPYMVSVATEKDAEILRDNLKKTKNHIDISEIDIVYGKEGLIKIAELSCDLVINALMGIMGLEPTLASIKNGNNIALANKETLVAGGELVIRETQRNNTKIIPIDSEHSAIYQCLLGRKKEDISRLILTGSGGPFRGFSLKELKGVTKSQALNHPNWEMGEKITVDSATLMNKGLELIEAKWLFDIDYKKIDVVIHPQSIIHSMVEFIDGSIISQMGPADMRLPISYAMSDPKRMKNDFKRLDLFSEGSRLEFFPLDIETFKCFSLAVDAISQGGLAPAVLNGANEVLVSMFLSEKIEFLDIPETLEKVMMKCDLKNEINLENILAADSEGRRLASSLVNKHV